MSEISLFDSPAENPAEPIAGETHAALLGDASPVREPVTEGEEALAAAGVEVRDRCSGCGADLPDDSHMVDRAARQAAERE